MNLHIGEDSRQFLKILQDLLKTFWGSWQEPWWSFKIFVHLRDNFFKFSTSTTVLIIWVSPRFCALWHPHFLHKLWPHLKYKRISIYTEHNTSKLSLTKFPPLVPCIALSVNIKFYGSPFRRKTSMELSQSWCTPLDSRLVLNCMICHLYFLKGAQELSGFSFYACVVSFRMVCTEHARREKLVRRDV